MITEYVYENQEYENVLVKIKAALMDIISSEENKLYEIEQKITTTTDEIFKEKSGCYICNCFDVSGSGIFEFFNKWGF